MHQPPHLHIITLIILDEEATQYAVLSSLPKLPLSPTYHPQQPILKYPQPTFFPKYDQPCFPPIYNRHSIFRNDIPLWYMMINCKNTYIGFLLVACFGCCEKQIIILQPLIENIITYFSIPIRWFSSQLHVRNLENHYNECVDILPEYLVHWRPNNTNQLYAHWTIHIADVLPEDPLA